MPTKIICRIKKSFPYIRLRGFLHSTGIIKPKGPKDYYISKISRKAPWVYISYIADPFYHLDDGEYLSKHQNKREAIAMVEVFNTLGYNVYVQDYFSKNDIPLINPQIILGHEPNMIRASKLYPDAKKIYYATGAYSEHQNNQIKLITDTFSKKYNCRIPYRRLVECSNPSYSITNAYKIADKILLIGSKFTVATFPEDIQKKITTIHQSTQYTREIDEIRYAPNNEFFFMGSSGNLLKGVSLLIEYFSEHNEFVLNLVGSLEEDVKKALQSKITPNIKLHGFMNVNSVEFIEIVNRCNFIIYPSGSEGMPGAVLNSMKLGLIPIVTKWSAFDEIEDYGYLMEEWNTESIDRGVKWGMTLTEKEVAERKKNCSNYVTQTYNIKKFQKEFEQIFI